MEAVKKGVPIKKLSARKFKKTVLFHLEAALAAAEGLEAREPSRGDKSLCEGLGYFIHNLKTGF